MELDSKNASLSAQLRERAHYARQEGTMTAQWDAHFFENAATKLENNAAIRQHLDMMLSYLRAFEFVKKDDAGYLKRMISDGEKMLDEYDINN